MNNYPYIEIIITQALRKKNWEVQQLAESLSRTESQIHKWLSGTNMTLRNLIELEIKLDIQLINTEVRWDIERIFEIKNIRKEINIYTKEMTEMNVVMDINKLPHVKENNSSNFSEHK